MPRRFKIVICRGPECGDRRGSSALQQLFHSSLDANAAREHTEVAWQSCFGRCTQGPNVLVRELVVDSGPQIGSGFATMPGPRGATALYNRMDGSRVERVVVQHVVGGQVVRHFIERPGILHSQPVSTQPKNKD
ncbi:MAG TPA: (2Fe-2S) ferredoxin domain-containing protein [Kofleriaceae bacterium]